MREGGGSAMDYTVMFKCQAINTAVISASGSGSCVRQESGIRQGIRWRKSLQNSAVSACQEHGKRQGAALPAHMGAYGCFGNRRRL